MKLPRDLSGAALAKSLQILGYTITRQTGSHVRLTTCEKGEHHVTVPNHQSLKIGTLAAILTDVAGHFLLSRNDLIAKLFGNKKY
ncbi:MAG: type II toxin-antitoxin system HicA family toxin [Deltaproteobacteria bacterium]|nr:type II toxin-antitoxin system HicA family toxin [Deltaproteobacteria bacterium]